MLGFIPARGGSQGIVKKNIRQFAGKPLIAYTIAAARESDISRVVVSTDSKEVAEIAVDYGAEVPSLRPAELARGDSVIEDALAYTLQSLCDEERYRPDSIILLQPTSPLRTGDHINRALKLLEHSDADSVVSVSEPMEHPAEMVRWESTGQMQFVLGGVTLPGIQQRQSYADCRFLNGAIYCFTTACFEQYGNRYGRNTIPLEMPQILSIDIDTEDDFVLAELVMNGLSSIISPVPGKTQSRQLLLDTFED